MATTTYGSPYVANTDLVSAWPGVSLNVAQRVDAVSYAGNGINAQTGTTYTLVLTDAGKNVTLSNASSVTVTIPANSSVAYATGTVISLTNLGAGTVTVAAGGGVTLNGSTLTISQYSASSIMKIATDTWVLTSGGGIPKAVFSSGGTTSSYSSGGITYSVRTFTATGTLVCSTAGLCDLLLVGGGAGSGNDGGGGAGDYVPITNMYLASGSYTVTVGAGGAGGTVGNPGSNGGKTTLAGIVAVGGGGGAYIDEAQSGGSGGGTGRNYATSYGKGLGINGFDGGHTFGGGGGSAGVGENSGQDGGPGTSNSLNGTATFYSAGGNAGSGVDTTSGRTAYNTAGAANSGSGAGANSKAGGSGVVIVRTS